MLRSLVGSEMCIRDRFSSFEGVGGMRNQGFTFSLSLSFVVALYPWPGVDDRACESMHSWVAG